MRNVACPLDSHPPVERKADGDLTDTKKRREERTKAAGLSE
jgi:hypothetical protein